MCNPVCNPPFFVYYLSMCFLGSFFFLLVIPLAQGMNLQGKDDIAEKSPFISGLLPLRPTSALVSQAAGARKQGVETPVEKPEDAAVSQEPWYEMMTQGIILAFHEWPDEREKTLILQATEKAGLKKSKEELPYTKVWFFRWTDNELRHVIEAHMTCVRISKIFSLRYCRPERMPRPRDIGPTPR